MAKVFNYFIQQMKKFQVIFFLLLAIPFLSCSQSDLRLSIKINPTITYNRFTSETDTLSIENLRDDVRLTFGLAADLRLTDSYFFSTGILYSLRKVSFVVRNEISGATEDEQYQLEYIEISMTFQFQEPIKIAVEYSNNISNSPTTKAGAPGPVADARHAPLTVGAKIGQRGSLWIIKETT